MTKAVPLKAPFPYFGGKARVAAQIWERLGDVDNYIEPFFGSGAILLLRPADHQPRIETVNDIDCLVANFWRATQHDPEAVVEHVDWPVNEVDLHARHRWLVYSDDAAAFRERMRTDPDYYDPKIAGRWCWGLCLWIGSGWCQHPEWVGRGSALAHCGDRQSGSGVHKKMPRSERGGGRGVHRKLPQQQPHISHNNSGCAGQSGVHALSAAIPHLDHGGQGVAGGPATWQQKPALADWNQQLTGVAGRPQLGDAYARGRGAHGNDRAVTCADRRAWLLDWFGRLRDRLRVVRVCSGDWLRVCGSPSVTTRLGLTGIFMDPPYALDLGRLHAWIAHLQGQGPTPEPRAAKRSRANRDASLYASDAEDVDRLVAHVHCYCLQRGTNPQIRIALCGYDGEHNALEAAGWAVAQWKSQGGYGNRSAKGQANARRERIWFSPYCLQPTTTARRLFA